MYDMLLDIIVLMILCLFDIEICIICYVLTFKRSMSVYKLYIYSLAYIIFESKYYNDSFIDQYKTPLYDWGLVSSS